MLLFKTYFSWKDLYVLITVFQTSAEHNMPLKKSTTTDETASVHTFNRRTSLLPRSKMTVGLGGEGGDGPEVTDVPSGDPSSFSTLAFLWTISSIPWILGMFSHSMGKRKE